MRALKWSVVAFCVFVALCDYALAIPLDNWTTWSTDQPYVSKQVPPGALIARCKDLDTYCVIEVDQTTGEIPVALSGASISIDFSGPTGDPVPADAGFVGGVDSGGDLRGLSVDTSGQLQVDVLSSALPSGAATEAKQDSEISLLTTIDADTSALAGTVAGSELQVDVVAALPAGNNNIGDVDIASSVLPTGAATEVTLSSVLTDTNIIAGTVSGFEMQVDVVAALPAGDNNIGNVDIASAIPAGTNNIGDVDVTNFPATVAVDAGAHTSSTIRTTEASRPYSDSDYNDYSSVNVTTAAWTELLASTAAQINYLCVTDTSGQIMELGTGAGGAETRLFLIAPGFSGCLPIRIAASTRVAIKAVTATASSGYFVMSGMQ